MSRSHSLRALYFELASQAVGRWRRGEITLADAVAEAVDWLVCAARTPRGTRIPAGEPTTSSHVGQTTWPADHERGPS